MSKYFLNIPLDPFKLYIPLAPTVTEPVEVSKGELGYSISLR